VITSY